MRAAEIRAELGRWLARYQPRHLAHVGAHQGEEVPYYLDAGIPRITLVEPLPELAAQLWRRYEGDPRISVVAAACSDQPGTAMLHVPHRTNMASLLPLPAGRSVQVRLVRLDAVTPDADAAVVDVQGHELPVLDAAPWQSLRLVMVETCTVDDPALSPPHHQVVEYMNGRGFTAVASLGRDYDWIQRWAYGRVTNTGGQVRDVIFVRGDDR